jgi:phosphoketolase
MLTARIGSYIAKVVEMNPKTFRIFSPDELNSNKLDECFKITHRNFQWDPETANNGGRVIEMLSEHTLQGWLQGYTLTGRHGLFPSYESFLGIVQTMIEVGLVNSRCDKAILMCSNTPSLSRWLSRPSGGEILPV